MAHLWTRNHTPDDLDAGTEWVPLTVRSGESFGPGPGAAPRSDAPSIGSGMRPRFVFTETSGGVWVLVSAPDAGLRVNGLPAPGIAVLNDRDELWMEGETSFFSTERLARVEPFPRPVSEAHCPRCKTELSEGDPAVCCPGCGVWHHEWVENELPCWSFGPRCVFCPFPTSMDGTWQWTPEAL